MNPQRGGWEALQPMLGDETPDRPSSVGDWLMVVFVVVIVGHSIWKLWS